jgi:hypothetical protein
VVRLHVRLYLCGRFRSQLEISWNHSVPYLQERKENSRVCALTFWRIEGGEKGSKWSGRFGSDGCKQPTTNLPFYLPTFLHI